MTSAFFVSLIAFCFALNCMAAQDSTSEEEFVECVFEEETDTQPQDAPPPRIAFSRKTQEVLVPDETPAQNELPKKRKAHFAGVKRPDPNAPKKASRRVKNQWFSSKTQPKVEKKEEIAEEEVAELPDDCPRFIRTSHIIDAPRMQNVPCAKAPIPMPANIDPLYPKTGFKAPNGHVLITAEWLYWRPRQEGMEFATTKNIEFDFHSGFRVGLGVHLPSFDGWEIGANYTYFRPKVSNSYEGGFYPLFLYQGAGSSGALVTHAQGHWVIGFQSLDIAFSKSYYLTERLVCSPFFGVKGAWIKQHAHFDYQGGYIPLGQSFRTHFDNDFKGAGPLVGTEINWQVGSGFSFFGDAAAAFAVGQFCNTQDEFQLNEEQVVHLDNDINLISPMLQLVVGIAWDRNFHDDMCHVGLSAGFETQYWWSQNQTEQFTDSVFPIYVRQRGNLGFYGLTLRAGVDF